MSLSRRRGREAALRALYQIDVGHSTLAAALEEMRNDGRTDERNAAYAESVVRGVEEERRRLDRRISALIPDYDWERVAAVDRNVLRLAAYELLHEPGIPPAVTLNEAIEIAKRYSTAESGRFVNGVLGALLSETPKAVWNEQDHPGEDAGHEAPPVIDAGMLDEVPPVEEVMVEEGSPEAATARRLGAWTIRQHGAGESPE